MTIFIKLVLLLWPLYQLSQVSSSRVYLLDPVILIAIGLQAKKIKFIHQLFKPAAFFISAAVLSLLLAATRQTISLQAFLYLIRLFLYFSLLLISLPKNSIKLLKFSFYLIPVLGILQYLILPDLRFLKAIGFDDHYFRLTFPFLDPNYTGAALTFIALYSIKEIGKSANKILFFLSLIALALTFSRISWLAFIVGLLYLIFKIHKTRFLVILSLIILSLLIFVSPKPSGEGVNLTRTFSIYSRFNNYQLGWNLFKQSPFTGIGYNTLQGPQHSSAGLDNSFLFVLATTGVLGLGAFLFFLYKSSLLIRNPYLKAAFLSLIIHSFANNTLFYAPITILCLLILNLSIRHSGKSSLRDASRIDSGQARMTIE